MLKLSSAIILGLAITPFALAQRGQGNPFAPPRASLHYALDRTCNLQHIDITMDIDYANRYFKGTTINTLSPLRSGLTEIKLMAGKSLDISSVKVDGKDAKYHRGDNTDLFITVPKTVKGKAFKVTISYSAKNSKARSFGGGGGGFHWIEPREGNAYHVGFWTQGEAETNCEWAPTWDYPNDLATSETHCTVESDWQMIGNGVLTSTKLSKDKSRNTFNWKMDQPHATYLLTMVGGPFDIKKDTWQGVDLWYVVPKGEGYMIDDSFGHTKDMLTFYSNILGVKYAWPKYAQNAMYDFGGGMENVSATTLGEPSLTEARDGYYRMDSLNSHELGHQWFGDLVTCKDWSDTWLNESFATYMQMMYFEHSRGQVAYDWEIEDAMQSYFREARRYKRPISDKMYTNGDAMFDSHTYPKGGVVLHTLRRWLGDESFFAGLHNYLTTWKHTPVESAQLRRAITEACGINTEPFWDQWFDKPGHPVIDYTWTYENGKVRLNVKQTQDTSDGTPIYNVQTMVDMIDSSGNHMLSGVHLSKAEETFEVTVGTKPAAVVFDPRHYFLREIPTLHWSDEELPYILKYGLNAPDRAEAMSRMMKAGGSANIQAVVAAVQADRGQSLVFRNITPLVDLADANLRSFWMGMLDHPNYDRRAAAVLALSKLPQDPATTAKLRSFINDKAPIMVVVNSIRALAAWDKTANADVFRAAQKIKDRRGRIKAAADVALGEAKDE
ncbi:MAG: aminopeptidase [Armatimonadetes bacterium]|nr:aminopeptidase [Armatimonadota bacterium]